MTPWPFPPHFWELRLSSSHALEFLQLRHLLMGPIPYGGEGAASASCPEALGVR